MIICSNNLLLLVYLKDIGHKINIITVNSIPTYKYIKQLNARLD